jgi:hypothetical protein
LGDLDVVSLALKFKDASPPGEKVQEGMRTDWDVGPCPPGYHLPEWTRRQNEAFVPIVVDEETVQG